MKHFLKKIHSKMNKNTILISIAVVAVVVVGVLIFNKSDGGFSLTSIFGMSDKQVAENTIKYINDNQLSQTPASLVKFSGESGLVKVTIKIGENEFDSYATKDGKLMFPQAFELTPKKDDGKSATSNTTPTEITKTDAPMLEAFVVARCPYGLQIQRAMADAVKNMPSLAPYMKARYIGEVSGNTITAMHGDAEAKENLRQICIREEQPTKYWNYVACQMKSGDTAGCQTSTGIDSAKLNSCISTPSKGVAYAKVDFDLSAKYGASGSPTMILNGTTVSESNYGGRSSDGIKSMICGGFNTPASFCSTALNTAEAAISFSETYASSASADSGSNAANCEPVQ
ncbi:MAG: hypothetical protein WC711_01420 [Candidatus Staskawiczbacteria bacterium]|jgi:hypothetical protein